MITSICFSDWNSLEGYYRNAMFQAEVEERGLSWYYNFKGITPT